MSHAPAVNGDTVGQRVGYTRVSTVARTLRQQREALEKAGVAKTFSDTMSGARDDRPGLAEPMAYVRKGDTVVVWKLDRLGRNTLHILETVKALTDRGVTLVSTTDGIDSSTAAGRMMIGVLGSLAEYERELAKERTTVEREEPLIRLKPFFCGLTLAALAFVLSVTNNESPQPAAVRP
jgi:DNA invertase Pin-like site-specific DNA recombinase